jgi:hypothetical protein
MWKEHAGGENAGPVERRYAPPLHNQVEREARDRAVWLGASGTKMIGAESSAADDVVISMLQSIAPVWNP